MAMTDDMANGQNNPRPRAELKLDGINVVLYDHKHNIRAIVRSTLDGIGFRLIHQCRSPREVRETIERIVPDLLILDLDEDFRAVCDLIHDIRYERLGTNPFLVIIGMSWHPEARLIESALEAGTDDLVRKPVSARLLAERITNLVHNRKDFVATPEYVGPQRARGPGAQADAAHEVVVPNSLREKSTGEGSARIPEKAVKRASQVVNLRRLHGLANEIGGLASEVENALAAGANHDQMREPCQRIAELCDRFNDLAGASKMPNLVQLAVSLANLTQIVNGVFAPHRRQIEILRLHAQAIAAATRGDVGAINAVASALDEAAVRVVGAGDGDLARDG